MTNNFRRRKILCIFAAASIALGAMTACGEDETKKSAGTNAVGEQTTEEDIYLENSEDSVSVAEESESEESEEEIPENERYVLLKKLLNDSLDGSVLYDKDGVTVYFEKFDNYINGDNAACTANFRIDNNNPDNKKVIFSPTKLNINGILNEIDCFATNAGIMEEITGGESVSRSHKISFDTDFYNDHQLPIETVGFDFEITVGAGGRPEEEHIVFKTSDYDSGKWEEFFGEEIHEFTVEGVTCKAYLKQNASGESILTIRNIGDKPLDFASAERTYWSINGSNVDYCGASDYHALGRNMDNILLEGGFCDTFTLKDPKTLRTELEISNDTPLDVNFHFMVNLMGSDPEKGELISFPVKIE